MRSVPLTPSDATRRSSDSGPTMSTAWTSALAGSNLLGDSTIGTRASSCSSSILSVSSASRSLCCFFGVSMPPRGFAAAAGAAVPRDDDPPRGVRPGSCTDAGAGAAAAAKPGRRGSRRPSLAAGSGSECDRSGTASSAASSNDPVSGSLSWWRGAGSCARRGCATTTWLFAERARCSAAQLRVPSPDQGHGSAAPAPERATCGRRGLEAVRLGAAPGDRGRGETSTGCTYSTCWPSAWSFCRVRCIFGWTGARERMRRGRRRTRIYF